MKTAFGAKVVRRRRFAPLIAPTKRHADLQHESGEFHPIEESLRLIDSVIGAWHMAAKQGQSH